jgi:hypothetical protein
MATAAELQGYVGEPTAIKLSSRFTDAPFGEAFGVLRASSQYPGGFTLDPVNVPRHLRAWGIIYPEDVAEGSIKKLTQGQVDELRGRCFIYDMQIV